MSDLYWYGCPRCSSSDYVRRQADEGDCLRIWFYCRGCCREFFREPVRWFVPPQMIIKEEVSDPTLAGNE